MGLIEENGEIGVVTSGWEVEGRGVGEKVTAGGWRVKGVAAATTAAVVVVSGGDFHLKTASVASACACCALRKREALGRACLWRFLDRREGALKRGVVLR